MKITELFQNREFVVSAEVGPPKGIHIDGMVEEAKKYLTGVHFVNVTDNQSSVMRLEPHFPADLPRPQPHCAAVRPAERRHAGH